MRFRNNVLVLTGLIFISPLVATQAQAQGQRPPLVITNAPLPADLKDKIYRKPVQTREISPNDVVGRDPYDATSVRDVSQKVTQLNNDLYSLQSDVSGLAANLDAVQRDNEQKAAEYYAAIATINTQLQTGTTPGNPRLVSKIDLAEENLESLSNSVSAMNQLAVDTAKIASEASYLLESARAAYSLAGAYEEDHVKLAELEDATNNTLVVIDRILNTVNDDITRASTYLSSERNNLRTLALAVSNGDMYGKSLANRPFSNVANFIPASTGGSQDFSAGATAPSGLNSARPLVKIRFDRADVEYEQPVYMAVNEALERYPNARFDLVAIHPTRGNAAEVAIESTKARRNAERVLRTLMQMGLPTERVDLSYSKSDNAASNEVHLYVK